MSNESASWERYQRQMALPDFGASGQEKLAHASVLIVGLGGLGSPAALYLAAAGLGRIGLLDPDVVAWSNLNRQILFEPTDLGKPKAEIAAAKLGRFNPALRLDPLPGALTPETAPELIREYAFVIDATDSFTAKYLISDTCVRENRPFCHGGLSEYAGQVFTYVPGQGAGCYRCLFPGPAPVAAPSQGVMGSTAGVMGLLMSQEAVKFFLGFGRLLINRLVVHDGLSAGFREIPFQPSPDCPVCRQTNR